MKKVQFIFAVILLVALIIPKKMLGHGSGLPQFFKVEGKIADTYPLQNAGVLSSTLTIPQDKVSRNFLSNETVSFEIDKNILGSVYPPETLDEIKFLWDFGDGSHAEGIKNNHKFNKIGSYILSINADFQDQNTPNQLIESVLVNVLPDKNYKLPVAQININGLKGIKENYNILDFDLAQTLSIDGSDSYSKSSKIIKYTWDFGDEKSEVGQQVTHKYELPQAFATVVLRVEDENGFFSDAYVNVRNNGKNEPDKFSDNLKDSKFLYFLFIIFVLILVIWKVRKRNNDQSN